MFLSATELSKPVAVYLESDPSFLHPHYKETKVRHGKPENTDLTQLSRANFWNVFSPKPHSILLISTTHTFFQKAHLSYSQFLSEQMMELGLPYSTKWLNNLIKSECRIRTILKIKNWIQFSSIHRLFQLLAFKNNFPKITIYSCGCLQHVTTVILFLMSFYDRLQLILINPGASLKSMQKIPPHRWKTWFVHPLPYW